MLTVAVEDELSVHTFIGCKRHGKGSNSWKGCGILIVLRLPIKSQSQNPATHEHAKIRKKNEKEKIRAKKGALFDELEKSPIQ